jgi:glutamyl-Q tRNA(Asp) synthetase
MYSPNTPNITSRFYSQRTYIGRFAPSPTGPLHLGSLVTALASWLDARAAHGIWRVRIEDVDQQRCRDAFIPIILESLQAHGLFWDGEIVVQRTRFSVYHDTLNQLINKGYAYPCACSRRDIQEAQRIHERNRTLIYPGTCRNGLDNKLIRAWRLRVPEIRFEYEDRLRGKCCQHLGETVGDFVLKRGDGEWAYQLAVVVDDAEQGITDVVRGDDLLDSTARQCYLQSCLGYCRPHYLHIPVVRNTHGEKLSKQTLAPALNIHTALDNLKQALLYLGLNPVGHDIKTCLDHAIEQWPKRLHAWRELFKII